MSFEARLSRAVCLALSLPAAQLCACAGASAPPPAPGAAEPQASASPIETAQVVAVAPPPDAGSADAGPTATPVATPPDAQALCKAYRDSHQEPQPGPAKPVEVESRDYADAVRGAMTGDGQVHCRIAWSRTRASSQVKRLIAPVCCQNHPGPRTPCPPATMEPLPTTRVVIEEVTLSTTGSVVRSAAHVEHQFQEPGRNHCGRRPEGAKLSSAESGSEAVVALRTMAELEAVSVDAFERLASELASFGAPAGLVARARDAAADEVRHARMMGVLARDAGLPPASEVTIPANARTLFEVALENAVEGCVYETYGAATALFQAQRATYPHLRAVFASIAPDEMAHAELAWDLDAWFATQLSESEVAQLRAAKTRAIARLGERLAEDEPPPGLGLPNRAEAETLCEATFADLVAA